MKDLLVNTLEALGYPVFLQGTLDPGEEYPADFITFFTNSSEDGAHFDNSPGEWEWNFTVNFYSNNPNNIMSVPGMIRAALKAVGFIPQGKGFDLLSDEKTHTGWAQEFLFLEMGVIK